MAVTADDRVAGEGKTVFRSDDVDDAVLGMSESEECKAEFLGIACEGLDLIARHGIGDRFVLIESGDIVVGRTVGTFRTEHLESA